MAGATTTIIKSVTLQAGESFVLPPGATLIGSSNSANLTSTCDLPELEEIGCFIAMIGSYRSAASGDFWDAEGNRVQVIGYDLNGVRTIFSSGSIGPDPVNPFGCFIGDEIGDALQDDLPAILEYNSGVNAEEGGGNNCITYLQIKTIPSVANNLELVLQGSGPLGNGTEIVINTTPFYPRADLVTDGYEDLPIPLCPEPV